MRQLILQNRHVTYREIETTLGSSGANCSLDLSNRNLQTTIIRNVYLCKADWILSELPLSALSCLLYHRVSSLMNVWRMSLPFRKLFKYKQVVYVIVLAVLLLPVFCLSLFLLHCCCCLFTSISLFYTDVVTIFLFIRWSCKQDHWFCF